MNTNSNRHESKVKPKSCPACGSTRIANIMYGKPRHSSELTQRVRNGEIVYGGCCITGDDPSWQCVTCESEIYSTL